MAGALAGFLFLLVAAGLLLAPGILLLLGWRDLRAARYERADTRATLAGMASVGQFALVGAIALLTILIQDANPAAMAVVLVPAALWVLSRRLHGLIRRSRETDRRGTGTRTGRQAG